MFLQSYRDNPKVNALILIKTRLSGKYSLTIKIRNQKKIWWCFFCLIIYPLIIAIFIIWKNILDWAQLPPLPNTEEVEESEDAEPDDLMDDSKPT